MSATDRSDARVAAASRRLVVGLTLTKVGDRIIDPKTVLAWFLQSVAAPAAFIGLLVPIRESGALLPQALIAPWVASHRRRTRVWIIGAMGQTVAAGGMAPVAVGLTGVSAGIALITLVTIFAVARSLCSLSIKDVLGRTIPAGARGKVTGWADSASGLVALTIGVGLTRVEAAPATTFAWLFVAAAALWMLAIAVMIGISEPDVTEPSDQSDGIGDAVALLRNDADFRHFVMARMLLLASALTPPFVVVLAIEATGDDISGLGPFVVASGLASLLGGRLWGGLADRSSRLVMATAAGTAAFVVAMVVVAAQARPDRLWIWAALYFVLALIHTGARVGRSTYVVELGDRGARTSYVAVSNTVMGLLLLGVGAITSGLAAVSTVAALVVLGGLGAMGVPVALRLPETGIGSD